MPAKGVSARNTALVKLQTRIDRARAKVEKIEATLNEARTALQELEDQVPWVGVKPPTRPFDDGRVADPLEGAAVLFGRAVEKEEAAPRVEKAGGHPPAGVEEMLEQGEVCKTSPCSGAGWTTPPWSRPDIQVCGRCGLPSRATMDRVAGERIGLSSKSKDGAGKG